MRLGAVLALLVASALGFGSAAASEPVGAAPTFERIFEFEAGELLGSAAVATDDAGYRGSGYVTGLGEDGAGVEIELDVERSGAYRLELVYANGPEPFVGAKTISIFLAGQRTHTALAPTGARGNWGSYTRRVELRAGETKLRLVRQRGDDGHIKLDYVRVTKIDAARFEAERAPLTGSARVASDHAGYSGDGYIDLPRDGSITFTVAARRAGEYGLVIGYSNGPGPREGTKTATLAVNESAPTTLRLPSTGAWTTWGALEQIATLRAGENTVAIRVGDEDTGLVEIDYLDVQARADPTPTPTPTPTVTPVPTPTPTVTPTPTPTAVPRDREAGVVPRDREAGVVPRDREAGVVPRNRNGRPSKRGVLIVRGGRRADATRSRRRARIRIACILGECEGRLELRARARALGSGRFGLKTGEFAVVRLRLGARARAQLAAQRDVRARLLIRYDGRRTERVRVRLTR